MALRSLIKAARDRARRYARHGVRIPDYLIARSGFGRMMLDGASNTNVNATELDLLYTTFLGRMPMAAERKSHARQTLKVVLVNLLASEEFRASILPSAARWEKLPQEALFSALSSDQLALFKELLECDEGTIETMSLRALLLKVADDADGLASEDDRALLAEANRLDLISDLFVICLGRKPGANDDLAERCRAGVDGAIARLLSSDEARHKVIIPLAMGDQIPHEKLEHSPSERLLTSASLICRASGGEGLHNPDGATWRQLLIDFFACPIVMAAVDREVGSNAAGRYLGAVHAYLRELHRSVSADQPVQVELIGNKLLKLTLPVELCPLADGVDSVDLLVKRGAGGKVLDAKVSVGRESPKQVDITVDLNGSGVRHDEFVSIVVEPARAAISVAPVLLSISKEELRATISEYRFRLGRGDQASADRCVQKLEAFGLHSPGVQAELLEHYARQGSQAEADAVVARSEKSKDKHYLRALQAYSVSLKNWEQVEQVWTLQLEAGAANSGSVVMVAAARRAQSLQVEWSELFQAADLVNERLAEPAIRPALDRLLDILLFGRVPSSISTSVRSAASPSEASLALLQALISCNAPSALVAQTFALFVRAGFGETEQLYDGLRDTVGMHRLAALLAELPLLPVKAATVRMNIARLSGAAGNHASALAFISPLLEGDHKLRHEAALLAANLHRKLGNWEAAGALFAQDIERGNDSPAILERLIEAERQLIAKDPMRDRERYDQAVARFHDVAAKRVMAQPGRAPALFDLARSYVMRGEADLALEILKESVQRSPDHLPSMGELIRLAVELKDNDLAIMTARAYLDREFSQWALIGLVKALRAEDRCDEAQALLAENFEDGTELIRREFVRNLFFLGDFSNAASEGERVIALQPEDLELRFLVAAAWMELGELEKSSLHAYFSAAQGGWEQFPLETPLFLYAAQQKSGRAELGLRQLNKLFQKMGCSDLRIRDIEGVPLFNRFEPAENLGRGDETPEDGVCPVYDGPLVSVVMTAYDAQDYVEVAAQSILDQSYNNIELIIVDDCSTDSTPQILMELEARDPRVKVILKTTNDGTYVSKNMGILQARGEFVALQDSDDWSHPDRIAKSVAALMARPDLVGVTTDWIRMTTDGEVVIKAGGQIAHVCCISLVFRREMAIRKLGFFDSVRIEADMEYIKRMALAFGESAVARLRWPLLFGRARSDSLTGSEEFGLTRTGYTLPRRQYQSAYGGWHSSIRSGRKPYMPFPLPDRHFEAPAIMLPEKPDAEAVPDADQRVVGTEEEAV